jgi:hypothetical protein
VELVSSQTIVSALTNIPEVYFLIRPKRERRFACAPGGRFAADIFCALVAATLGFAFAASGPCAQYVGRSSEDQTCSALRPALESATLYIAWVLA